MAKRTKTVATQYETEKLNLAAYLIASDATALVRAYCPENGHVVVFTLSPAPSPEQISAFFNGSGQVSALSYNNALSNLKAAVFEAKRGCRRVCQ